MVFNGELTNQIVKDQSVSFSPTRVRQACICIGCRAGRQVLFCLCFRSVFLSFASRHLRPFCVSHGQESIGTFPAPQGSQNASHPFFSHGPFSQGFLSVFRPKNLRYDRRRRSPRRGRQRPGSPFQVAPERLEVARARAVIRRLWAFCVGKTRGHLARLDSL